jgi:hypothetical protein
MSSSKDKIANKPDKPGYRDSFWKVPKSMPGITDEQLRQLEGHLGYPLPSGFAKRLKQCDGGYLRRPLFYVSAREGQADNMILEVGSLWSRKQLQSQTSLDAYRPDGRFEGHCLVDGSSLDGFVEFGLEETESYLLCFDYRAALNAENAAVVYLRYHLLGGTLEPIKIADSYAEFEQMLFSKIRYDGYLLSEARDRSDLERVVSALKAQRGESPCLHDGELLPDGELPNWQTAPLGEWNGQQGLIWFEINRTPVGVVQFPDCASDAWILCADVDPKHRAELKSLLAAASIPIQELHLVEWWRWEDDLDPDFQTEQKGT